MRRGRGGKGGSVRWRGRVQMETGGEGWDGSVGRRRRRAMQCRSLFMQFAIGVSILKVNVITID